MNELLASVEVDEPLELELATVVDEALLDAAWLVVT